MVGDAELPRAGVAGVGSSGWLLVKVTLNLLGPITASPVTNTDLAGPCVRAPSRGISSTTASLPSPLAALEPAKVPARQPIVVVKHLDAFLAQLLRNQRPRLDPHGLAAFEPTGDEDEPPLAPRTALVDVVTPDRFVIAQKQDRPAVVAEGVGREPRSAARRRREKTASRRRAGVTTKPIGQGCASSHVREVQWRARRAAMRVGSPWCPLRGRRPRAPSGPSRARPHGNWPSRAGPRPCTGYVSS